MKILELMVGMFVLACILILYLVIRQTLGLDAVAIGLVIIIYIQQNQIRKIKKDLYEKNIL